MLTDARMKECKELCWECRNHCQEILYNYCLDKGGKHIEARHINLMTDCIQICQTAADFMTRNSPLHGAVCYSCAEICKTCAESCRNIRDDKMQECADICERCAQLCESMSEQFVGQAAA